MKKMLLVPTVMALVIALMSGCALPDAASPASAKTGGLAKGAGDGRSGTVEIRVTDAPRSDNVTEIWVKVGSVQIHKATAEQEQDRDRDQNAGAPAQQRDRDRERDGSGDGQWISANITGPNPFELLALKDGGIQQILGSVNMTAGKYTQIRLTVESVRVKVNGVYKDGTVPSGTLKFVRPFEVKEGQTTVLLFDFDADKSVVITGSGKVMVKPVVKLTVESPRPTGTGASGPQSLRIVTPGLPNGAVNASYSTEVVAAGGTPPYVWSISAGALPTGLSINGNTGLVSGTPTAAGDYTFTVAVADNSTSPKTVTKQYTVTIAAAGDLIITTTSLPEAVKNTAYTVTLQAVGGIQPYAWSLISGTLPPGLVFDLVSGVISGTPTGNGNFNITVQVSDNSTPLKTDTQALTLSVRQN